jgi:hypothetical protein
MSSHIAYRGAVHAPLSSNVETVTPSSDAVQLLTRRRLLPHNLARCIQHALPGSLDRQSERRAAGLKKLKMSGFSSHDYLKCVML